MKKITIMKNKEKKQKLKVAFPHMGTIYIAWASCLRRLGVEPFVPPYTSKKTLSIGTKNSPESICLPYKLILGNFVEAIEAGADYVAMISSPGICRLGEYGKSIKNNLKNMGYEANYIELQLYDGIKGLYRFITELTPIRNPFVILSAINLMIQKIFVLDKLEQVLSFYRARELKCGTAERAFKQGLHLIYEADSLKQLDRAKREVIAKIRKTPIDKKRDVVYVDITGEIFLVLDYFANQNIEKELGKMGVQTRRTLTVSSFLKDAIIPKFLRKGETHLQRAFRLAKPYLSRDIGGDALESVSDVVYANKQGRDGIIHISPFTCMPEIMSQNIFPKMREDVDIPILTLIMDEQTGKAGYITRLEAFVDLMRRKKRKNKIKASKEFVPEKIL